MSDHFTPEQKERLLAAIVVGIDPLWARVVTRILLVIPGCVGLADRLDRWLVDRAVRRYRQGTRPS